MTLDQILGQDRALGILRRVLDADRLAHAYVFAGPGGTGKRTTALALAAACLCQAQPGRGCGRCTGCRLVEAGSHPDLFVEDLARARLEKPAASHVSIEQVRRIRSHLTLRPVHGGRKLGVIDQAERLTADAQNALLKTLEEPRGCTTLVLIATNPDALLPTIRSRCQCVRFAPLDAEVIERILVAEGADGTVASAAAELAEGSAERARELAAGDGARLCRELRARLEKLHEIDVPAVLDLANELSPPRTAREQQGLYLATVLEWCRRGLRAAVDASRERATAAGAGDPASEAGLEEVRRAARQLERAYATSRDLARNANAHLAWDCLLLDLHRGAGEARVRIEDR